MMAAFSEEFEKIAVGKVQMALAKNSGTYRRHLIGKLQAKLGPARERAASKAKNFSKGWKKTHGRGAAGIRHAEKKQSRAEYQAYKKRKGGYHFDAMRG